jgi:hypothetical protein
MALPCPAARSVLEILEIHQESSFDRISFQIEGVDGSALKPAEPTDGCTR